MRTLDYEYVASDPYPHQVTVKTYLFGLKLGERVIATKDWEYFSGLYELPSLEPVSILSGTIARAHTLIRQIKYTEHVAR